MTRSLLLTAAVLSAAMPAPLSGQRLDATTLPTKAEATGFIETSRYDDVMEMAHRLAELSDEVHITSFGYTNEGRSLPLLVF